MSMVLMMMAGVVRKKKRKKRKVLIAIKRVHQLKRRMDRCFLGKGVGEKRGTFRPREITQMEGERKQYFFLYVSCGPGPACRGRWDVSLGTPFVKAQTTSQRLQ